MKLFKMVGPNLVSPQFVYVKKTETAFKMVPDATAAILITKETRI